MKAKMKSLKVTLGARELEFTMEEAEALLDALQSKLGRPAPIIIDRREPYYDQPRPVYVPNRTIPTWDFPQITCRS